MRKFLALFGLVATLAPGLALAASQTTITGPTGNQATVNGSGSLSTQSSNLPAAVDTNTGAAGASTLRVVPATGSTVAVTGAYPADSLATGTINSATLNATYSVALAKGQGVTAFAVSGLTASGAALTLQGSNDGGTTWTAINEIGVAGSVPVSTLAADAQFRVNTGGRTNVRLLVSVIGTGTITVASNASTVSSAVTILSSLPGGTNPLGSINVLNGGDIALGTTTDAANCGTSFSLIACARQLHADNVTTLAAINGAIPTQPPTVNIGAVGISQTTPGTTNAVQPIAGTTGGATAYGLQATASTNSTLVSTGAHSLYGMNLINTTTTIYYLRMYDSAGAPTCSSATGFVRSWPIPPASAAGGASGIAVSLPATGTAFATGLAFCLTGGPSSTDNTNAATGVFANLDYK